MHDSLAKQQYYRRSSAWLHPLIMHLRFQCTCLSIGEMLFVQSANVYFCLSWIRHNLEYSKMLCMCVLEKEIGKDKEKKRSWYQMCLIKSGLSKLKQDSSQGEGWELVMYIYVLWPCEDEI